MRLDDWRCLECARVREALCDRARMGDPDRLGLVCRACGFVTEHRRMLPRIAHHMPKPIQALIAGGAFDTAGFGKLSPLPPVPDQATDRLANFREFVSTQDYRAVKAERAEQKKRNLAKRARAGLIRSGHSIDLRHDRLPGDPKNIGA